MYRLVLFFLCAWMCAAADRVDSTTLEGKVLFGYQGWFDCPSDRVPGSAWSHWSHGVPGAETLTIDMYPDLSEFDKDELCAVPGMNIGDKPAYLFTAKNAKTVLRHFQWMKDYGLDGVLVQRFIGGTVRSRAQGDVVLRNIMAAAAQTGRTFAIEYDISGGKEENFFQLLKEDWAYLVDEVKVTAHPNYLHHKGRPVLSVWGMGLSDVAKHPPADPQVAMDVVKWFKSGAAPKYRVTYMGGTPARWRTLQGDAAKKAGWADAYCAMDVVQPWTIGRYRNNAQAAEWKTAQLEPDVAELKKNGQLYMPVIFPGFSWFNLNRDKPKNDIPRNGGEFLWLQAVNARAAGATMLKIAMFDEVNESTAMFKLASKRKDAPDQGFWLTLDADGRDLPSDWYLRLAGEITKAFHNGTALRPTIPAQK